MGLQRVGLKKKKEEAILPTPWLQTFRFQNVKEWISFFFKLSGCGSLLWLPPPKLTFYAFFFKTISCLPPSLLSALINTRTHHFWFYSETFLSHTIQRILPPSRSPLDSLRRRKSILLASLHLKVKVWNVWLFFFNSQLMCIFLAWENVDSLSYPFVLELLTYCHVVSLIKWL